VNPESADLLAQLRDIHGAPAAPLWPPAPGWWVLAVIVAIGLAMLIRRAIRQHHIRQRRLQLIRFLEKIEQNVDPAADPQEYLSSLNRVFKIVALRAFPESHCALMQGREWTDFVQIKLGDIKKGEQGAIDDLVALADGPYQPAPVFNPESLSKATRQWIYQYG
jgi:hypothetical protein